MIGLLGRLDLQAEKTHLSSFTMRFLDQHSQQVFEDLPGRGRQGPGEKLSAWDGRLPWMCMGAVSSPFPRPFTPRVWLATFRPSHERNL